jgi:hypothetical protein
VTIYVTYWGCTDRGMDNGAHVAKVTKAFFGAANDALGSAGLVGYHEPL